MDERELAELDALLEAVRREPEMTEEDWIQWARQLSMMIKNGESEEARPKGR